MWRVTDEDWRALGAVVVFEPADALAPNTLLASPGEAVPLYGGPCVVAWAGTTVDGVIDVFSGWDGSLHGVVRVVVPQGGTVPSANCIDINVGRGDTPLVLAGDPVVELSEDLFGDKDAVISLRLAPQTVQLRDGRTDYVAFTTADFPPGIGGKLSAQVGDATTTSSRLRFSDGRWRVTLDNVSPWLFAHWLLETGSMPETRVPLDLCGDVLRGEQARRARRLLRELRDGPEAGPPALPRGLDLSVTGAALSTLSNGDYGGTAITHAGELRRADGSLFNKQEAGKALERLRGFVRLLAGGDSPVLTERGHDRSGTVVWHRWAGQTAGRSRFDTWLPRDVDPSEGGGLDAAWTGFGRIWGSGPEERRLLSAAVDAFVLASMTGSAAAGLVQAQAGLEVLAYRELHLVHGLTAQSVNASGGPGLPAADKIRLLLALSGVDPAVPDRLADLRAWCGRIASGNSGKADGAFAVTALRNDAVHPVPKRAADEAVTEQARRLAVRYLLLCILAWIGYNGVVSNLG